jgi:hypothetical protein
MGHSELGKFSGRGKLIGLSRTDLSYEGITPKVEEKDNPRMTLEC